MQQTTNQTQYRVVTATTQQLVTDNYEAALATYHQLIQDGRVSRVQIQQAHAAGGQYGWLTVIAATVLR